MIINVNSKAIEIKNGINLKQWLQNSKYRIDLVAIEYNGNIVKKSDWEKFILKDGINLEIVEFVGGG